jgi:hypothetical protein
VEISKYNKDTNPIESILSYMNLSNSMGENLSSSSLPLSTFLSRLINERLENVGETGRRGVALVSDNHHSHATATCAPPGAPPVQKNSEDESKENLQQHAVHRWATRVGGDSSSEEPLLRFPSRSSDHDEREEQQQEEQVNLKIRKMKGETTSKMTPTPSTSNLCEGTLIKKTDTASLFAEYRRHRKDILPKLPFMEEPVSTTDYTIASMAASLIAASEYEAPRLPRRKPSFSGAGNRRTTKGRCISVRVVSVHA